MNAEVGLKLSYHKTIDNKPVAVYSGTNKGSAEFPGDAGKLGSCRELTEASPGRLTFPQLMLASM